MDPFPTNGSENEIEEWQGRAIDSALRAQGVDPRPTAPPPPRPQSHHGRDFAAEGAG